VKRPLPLWIATVVPATLVGHGLAYAAAGRSVADAHHAWVAPALECSLAVLATLCFALVADALLKAGILAHTSAERSVLELWPRLAVAQLTMFAAMERLEGTNAGVIGCLVQIAVALCVAYVLSIFSRLLVRCIAGAASAARYLARLTQAAAPLFVVPQFNFAAHALAVRAGTARFQRPPPVG
jgi:hypothetical protein